MKKTAYLIILLCCGYYYSAAQVGIGTTTPDASSILDVESTDKGILIPRLTTVQINAITNPANGLIVFNTDLNEFHFNCGTTATPDWVKTSHSMSVKYSNTDTTTNVNPNTTPINLPILGNLEWNDNTSLYTANTVANTITVTQDGRYKITVNVSLLAAAATARLTPEMWIEINGTQQGAYGSTGYIRNNGGHQESSLHITEVLNLTANDIISVSIVRTGANGSVNLRSAGTSNIYIEKIK